MDGDARRGCARSLERPSTTTSRSPRSSRPRWRTCSPTELASLLDPLPPALAGCVCVVLKTRRSLLPYYAVNICEPTPITTCGGDDPGARYRAHRRSSPRLPAALLRTRTRPEQTRGRPARCTSASPASSHGWCPTSPRTTSSTGPCSARVSSSRSTGSARDPACPRCGRASPGLALASNAQIYPWLLNGDSVVRFAERVAGEAAGRLALEPARPSGVRPRAVSRPADPGVERRGEPAPARP